VVVEKSRLTLRAASIVNCVNSGTVVQFGYGAVFQITIRHSLPAGDLYLASSSSSCSLFACDWIQFSNTSLWRGSLLVSK